ncbi:MAG: FAD-dependent oxidoreductase, partial [Planctomycetes bacterium]|nr:FAD-dependent oxidoreductase [Planctomycetota bacterium]
CGTSVTVVDPAGVAAGASGLRAAVVQPRLWRGDEVPDAGVVADAFRWTVGWLRRERFAEFSPCGVLRVVGDERELDELRARVDNPATADLVEWVDRETASARFGIPVPFGAGWIADAGWLDVATFVRTLLAHDRIDVRPDVAPAEVDLRVLATAHAIDADFLPIEPTRGQTVAVRWPASARPRSVLSGAGYATPADAEGLGWIGSTYDRGDASAAVRDGDDERILSHFAAFAELRVALTDSNVERRFAGVRATTPDRLPYVGALPSLQRFTARFGAAIRSHAETASPSPNAWEPATLVSLAHGSRGAVTAPFAGELLAARAFGEPLPIRPDSRLRIEPARALVRSIRRASR